MADRKRASLEPPLSKEQLAHLGEGSIAYVKRLEPQEAALLFPQIDDIKLGLPLFALVSADGSPIILTDSRDVAIANAWEHELQMVSLH
jgi:hypothetical protein